MFRNFLHIIREGLSMDGAGKLVLWIVVAIAFSALCWWACTHYTKLWNKRYHVTDGFHVLCGVAALVTFFAVLAFIGLKNTKPVAEEMVKEWSEEVVDNPALSNRCFKEAFYAVKQAGKENMRGLRTPENGGNFIPMNHTETLVLVSHLYASRACEDFGQKYPFIGHFLKADDQLSTETVKKDIQAFFRTHPGGTYNLNHGFELAVGLIREGLQAQTGRIVRITRTWLVLLFLLVQLIPFGAIGYLAYQDLFKHRAEAASAYKDDFDIDNI